MKYRQYGSTPLEVSEIAMGSMHFKWIISENEAFKILDYFCDQGGNLIDTSDMYAQWVKGFTGGEAETIIGKWFKKRKSREKIILTSKVRARMWEGPDGEGLTKKHIIKACEQSLRRLQTDYLDLYLSHWPDQDTPIMETTLAYQQLAKQGKIRFFGCSNYPTPELKAAIISGLKVDSPYHSVQSYYNLLQRFPFEKETLPLIKKYNLAFTPYSPLAGGFLTGAFRKGNPASTHPRAQFAEDKITEKNLALIDILEKIGQKYNKNVSEVVLSWMLSHDWITSIIMGSETIEQLRDGLKATNFQLSPVDIKAINAITS